MRYEFLVLDTCEYHPDIYSYVRKDVRIRGFFRSPKGYANIKLEKHCCRLWSEHTFVLRTENFKHSTNSAVKPKCQQYIAQ
jgi:hypothetical protein